MMGSPTSDTTYFVDLIVERNGKNVIVLNSAIHIDSLWEGKEYTTGSGSNYSSIQFIGDSLYIHYNSGGLGGGSYGTYKGKKKKS